MSGPITIMAQGSNAVGDVFSRLLQDFFYSLGYDECAFNIAKTGREIDVRAGHRTEQRTIRAEAKAHARPIGGADINKFVGVLDAERRTSGSEVVGYFVSLSGFTASALEQEAELGNGRVVLVDASALLAELSSAHVIVPRAQATERAGRCAAGLGKSVVLNPESTLIAHEMGWIWAVSFSTFKKPSHLCLIHADGQPLSEFVAADVLDLDKKLGGELHGLTYLPPEDDNKAPQDLSTLEGEYREAVCRAYDLVTLEGLPADETSGAKPLHLNAVYVPTALERVSPSIPLDEDAGDLQRNIKEAGAVLANARHLAVLGLPGAGKSTFVKRLATYYSSPDPQHLDDELPARDWLPFVIRCRQVQHRQDLTIVSQLNLISANLEMGADVERFSALVRQALTEGRALVLVDGLDELSEESLRIHFVQQLRSFMSTYPASAVIMTSREAGFRSVAPAVAGACEMWRVADLDYKKVEKLTIAWHREVVGKGVITDNQARELAASIWRNDRVRLLASNPLLLTTLLLVQRWAGELPRRRSVLYDKAIEVLLMTWNVEGHAPIERDEALPQLAYLAFRMMESGEKQISSNRLFSTLSDARNDMPEILGFAKTSVSTLVARIEDRSSLIVQSGHAVEDGVLRPLYEFKHLTFQEFLAALAAVHGYFPGGSGRGQPEEVLAPFLQSPGWREVVPLAAVLAGRNAGSLVELLIQRTEAEPFRKGYFDDDVRDQGQTPYGFLLRQCLIDEAQISPTLARSAIEITLRRWDDNHLESVAMLQLMTGRYSDLLESALKELAVDPGPSLVPVVNALSQYVDFKHGGLRVPDRWKTVVALLEGSTFSKVEGLLLAMTVAFEAKFSAVRSWTRQPRVRSPRGRSRYSDAATSRIVELLGCESPEIVYCACWALAWISRHGLLPPVPDGSLHRRLFMLWRRAPNPDGARMAAWAFSELPIVETDDPVLGPARGHKTFLRERLRSNPRTFYAQDDFRAAILAAAYFGTVLNADALVQLAKEAADRGQRHEFAERVALLLQQ